MTTKYEPSSIDNFRKFISYKFKDPDEVSISEDGSVPTTFRFKSPVYLEPKTEYALVLKSKVTNYKVWIARLGEADVRTLGSEAGQVLVSKQPTLGSLFKSQNSSVWTPSQYEDLKYDLYRADFKNAGSISFYNPKLPEKLEDLPDKGIAFKPNKVRVGLGITYEQDATLPSASGQTLEALKIGNTVFQANTDTFNSQTHPNGTLVGFAGSIVAVGSNGAVAVGNTTLTLTDGGTGIEPLGTQVPGGGTDSDTYVNVAFESLTGTGQNARGNILVLNGEAIQVTCTTGGTGYAAGDVLTATLGDGAGEGLKFTVKESNIGGFNELVLTDVQGDFTTSASAYSLRYVDSTLGIGTVINYAGSAPIEVKPTSTTVSDGDDGLHLKIRMKNHGMYNSINKVTLTDVESDLNPSTITQSYSRTSTANLGVLVGSGYTTFEGLTVGAAQTGYIRIEDEIIGLSLIHI